MPLFCLYGLFYSGSNATVGLMWNENDKAEKYKTSIADQLRSRILLYHKFLALPALVWMRKQAFLWADRKNRFF